MAHAPEELARVLVLYRDRHQLTAKPTLSGRALGSVEHLLEIDIPDDLVALFAATGRGLDHVVALTEEAREGYELPRHQLVVAKSDEPLRQWRAKLTVVDHEVDRAAQTPVFYCSTAGKRAGDDLTVAAFAREFLELRRPETESERARVDAAIGRFRPRVLVDAKQLSSRRVRHLHFGDGRVIREMEGGRKLEVEFDQERVLVLATFCADLAAEEASP